MLVPATHGSPPQMLGSEMIRRLNLTELCLFSISASYYTPPPSKAIIKVILSRAIKISDIPPCQIPVNNFAKSIGEKDHRAFQPPGERSSAGARALPIIDFFAISSPVLIALDNLFHLYTSPSKTLW